MILLCMGLGLQVVGAVVAGCALVFELRAPAPKRPQAFGEPHNPWSEPLSGMPRVESDWAHRMRSRSRAPNPLDGRQPDTNFDPRVAELADYVATWIRKREALAAQEWTRQTTQERAVTSAFLADLAELHRRTRVRVLWEMGGLALVVAGTVVGGVGTLLE